MGKACISTDDFEALVGRYATLTEGKVLQVDSEQLQKK